LDNPAALVVDSTGAKVGPYFPSVNDAGGFGQWHGQDAVMLTVNGFALIVPVTSSGFLPTGEKFQYTSSDCSGTAYLPVPFVGMAQQGFTATVNTTLYYVDPATDTNGSVVFNSRQSLRRDGSVLQSSTNESVSGDIAPARTLDLSTLGFVPPFAVRVK
jgi:hypothetical protein